ncbi:MAG: hypothetical protein IJX58_03370, partial [Clostridia bacterium]|nr:hypothetical protein [Clostridia bacterium]
MMKICKIIAAMLLIIILLFNTVSCDLLTNIGGGNNNSGNSNNSNGEQKDENFYIDAPLNIEMKVGESMTLGLVIGEGLEGEVVWTSSSSCVSVENGVITANTDGVAVVKAILGNKTDSVIVTIKPTPKEEYVFGSEYPCISIAEALEIAVGYTSSASTEIYYMVGTVTEIVSASSGRMYISDESGSIYVYKSSYISDESLSATDLAVGDILIISGTLRNYKGTLEIEQGTVINYYTPGVDDPSKPDQGGNDPDIGDDIGSGDGNGEEIVIPDTDDPITDDPYVGVDEDEFYKNYTPAISYMDAYYRTKHNLMSGRIDAQDQAPTISKHRPKSDGKYIRNNTYIFSEDGNTYYVVDCYGEIAFEVYYGAAYVILEEVAAYVFAFGEPPVNQSYSKNTKPYESVWGEYLRLNNTKFSGDTSKYPYEPVLPRISGCGGDLTYYEMDIGTTGTDCDPSYTAELYNNGYYITRGAARIVYSCKDRNGNKIIDLDERYVFYTYNHYNDFQEYLNYEGGWGEMFGNI